MNKPRNNNASGNYTKKWNSDKQQTTNKQSDQNFFDYFNPAVEVRNNDVNKALRVLKKKLERDDFLKDIAKLQYYEKPSVKRKRTKAQSKKRHEKSIRDREATGEYKPYMPTGVKHLKSKRKSRKITEYKDRLRSQQQGRQQ